MSEHAAYHRIEAARAARRFPIVLALVADGSVTLTTVALLRSHLTESNHEVLLAATRHKSKRDVEHLVASLAPKPDATPLIRKLPTQSTTLIKQIKAIEPSGSSEPLRSLAMEFEVSAAAEPRPKVAPLSGDRYLLRVTLSAESHAKLRRAQDLMAHAVPDGNRADIIDKALTLLVAQLDRAKIAAVSRPRMTSKRPARAPSGSRHIPAAIRRQVWGRDDGRCGFVRCRAHNGYESEQVFGLWPGRAVETPLDSSSP